MYIDTDLGLYILRFAVAIVFLYHGLPKLKKAKMMSAKMGMPAGMIWLLGLVESLSSVGLLLGFYVGISALLLVIVMVGAIFLKTMKWKVPFSSMNTTGWELDWILLASGVAILFTGGGSYGLF